MKLHLIDTINNRNRFYNIDYIQEYYGVWKEIDKIIDEYNYSCIGFPIPELKKEEHIIIVHWFELFGTLSTPYIEILECSDKVLASFNLRIQKYNRIKELKRK